jgi:hypothetical protein
MRRQVLWFVAAVLLGVLGGAAAAGLDETTIVAEVSAADHEVDEGYFTLGDGATVIAKPGSELHRFLTAHRGQKVRLAIEGTRDGISGDPSLRPGSGRDSGQISRLNPGGRR